MIMSITLHAMPCRGWLRRSSTLASLGDDDEFTSEEYISTGMRPFGKPKEKSISYHCGES